MSENQGFSGTHLFFAVLGGAVAGAAVAMLTTPRSGPETRALMNDAVADGRARVADAVANGRQKARGLPGAVKVASVAARDAFTSAMDEAGA